MAYANRLNSLAAYRRAAGNAVFPFPVLAGYTPRDQFIAPLVPDHVLARAVIAFGDMSLNFRILAGGSSVLTANRLSWDRAKALWAQTMI